MKVADYFRNKVVDGDVGVEIEVEGKYLPPAPKNWRAEMDGSLKAEEALEYVMRQPVKIEDLEKSLVDLKEAFVQSGAVFNNSYRAGIHVHVNCQELSLRQLASMISCYIIFDNSIVNTCDKFRRGNHFCLRAEDAQYLVRRLKDAFILNDPAMLNDDIIRYSSMNVSSLYKYGSVEFRALESTDDFSKIYKFAKKHYQIREFAKKFDTPQNLIQHIHERGFYASCKDIFQDQSAELTSQQSFIRDCEVGLEFAEDLAFCKNWGEKSLDIFQTIKDVF